MLLALAFSSCQSDEVAPFRSASQPSIPGDKAPNPYIYSKPPEEVIRTDYAGATQWWIRYNDPIFAARDHIQVYFNTVDGSFQNLFELNSSRRASAKADMDILFGYIKSPINSYDDFERPRKFKYPEYLKNTQLKPSDLGLWDLAVMTYNPSQFQSEFENSPYEATNVQPYNYVQINHAQEYQVGDIFLFKTARVPVRYGAIRIITVPGSDPMQHLAYILEITVQADNNIVELGN